MEEGKRWDLFISHAAEDEEEIARPLANALNAKGLKVWSGNYALKLGDNLRESIDYGLVRAKSCIMILSNRFFEKQWPREELDHLATREVIGKKVILPYGIKSDSKKYSDTRLYCSLLKLDTSIR